MSIHIIIDGYNFIHQSQVLSELDTGNLQQGRQALIAALARYKGAKAHRITVVFDGTAAPAHLQRRDHQQGIEIRFSAWGQTADHLIQNLAAQKREKAIVVSSDRGVTGFAETVGAATLSSPEFEQKVWRAIAMDPAEEVLDNDAPSSRPPGTRKKGPKHRLPKKQRRNQRRTKKL